MTTVTAKMTALILTAKSSIQSQKDNATIGTVLAMQSVANMAMHVYGVDKDGILSFARDTSLFLWDEKKWGKSQGYFFENVLNDFYAQNDQRGVSGVIVDMYKQIILKVQFG